jgi:maleate isomerase
MTSAHAFRIGIATPMANPTVEPELRALFPADVNMLVTRSVAAGDSRTRLLAYFEYLERSLESFGGLELDAFGFACTASSYLLEPGLEHRRCAELSDRFTYPVITASQAIEQALRSRGVKRLAIASPYPAWIAEACRAFWTRTGFDVVAATTAAAGMTDTRGIYALDPEQACARFVEDLSRVEATGRADALLVTGTGLPTLPLLGPLGDALGLPVLSSNGCLAEACLRAARCRHSL